MSLATLRATEGCFVIVRIVELISGNSLDDARQVLFADQLFDDFCARG